MLKCISTWYFAQMLKCISTWYFAQWESQWFFVIARFLWHFIEDKTTSFTRVMVQSSVTKFKLDLRKKITFLEIDWKKFISQNLEQLRLSQECIWCRNLFQNIESPAGAPWIKRNSSYFKPTGAIARKIYSQLSFNFLLLEKWKRSKSLSENVIILLPSRCVS